MTEGSSEGWETAVAGEAVVILHTGAVILAQVPIAAAVSGTSRRHFGRDLCPLLQIQRLPVQLQRTNAAEKSFLPGSGSSWRHNRKQAQSFSSPRKHTAVTKPFKRQDDESRATGKRRLLSRRQRNLRACCQGFESELEPPVQNKWSLTLFPPLMCWIFCHLLLSVFHCGFVLDMVIAFGGKLCFFAFCSCRWQAINTEIMRSAYISA